MDCGLSFEDVSAIKNVFAANAKIKGVLLFGSRAMGNYKPGSDIDLAIESDDLTFDDLLEIAAQLEHLGLLYRFDLQILKEIKDPEVAAHIRRVGKPLYSAAA